jgi:hypothetical protein
VLLGLRTQGDGLFEGGCLVAERRRIPVHQLAPDRNEPAHRLGISGSGHQRLEVLVLRLLDVTGGGQPG